MAAINQWNNNAPNYLTGAVPDEFDSVKYNFQWIRRVMMALGFIPIHGATRQPTYNVDGTLQRITFGGTISGYIQYNYDVNGDLTSEVWSIDSKTMTITYTIVGGIWQGDSVSIT